MRIWKSNILFLAALAVIALISACSAGPEAGLTASPAVQNIQKKAPVRTKNEVPVIHVIVALCDNENQGIVPVPKHLGNGEDPARNLYWGAAYGVETYFGKSRSWERLADLKVPKDEVLKRIAFKHKKTGAILVADAYRGIDIKTSLSDFLGSTAGKQIEEIEIDNKSLQILGSADVLAYVGHNGLMDFRLDNPDVAESNGERDAIVLACLSKKYFSSLLKGTGTKPLVWTTNFMAPEAYILHDALEGRLNGESDEQVRMRAAKAYAKYQRISVRAAKGLLVTGW